MVRQPKKPSPAGKSKPRAASVAKQKNAGAIAKPKSETGPQAAPAIPVVGLGASAGGLQAFTEFFEAMPDKTGMAFVIIHHVDPDHESLMADLLAKHTEMTVALATDQTKVAPDHVYIIPPKRFLRIENGTLYLTEPTERRGMRLPVDYFLRALAVDQKQNAVAIILSGTGSDGTAGVRSIKEHGGLVLVQDPKQATHDGMPRSAIATGSADHILPVAKMSKVIAQYIAHPYIAHPSSTKVLGENARGALADIIAVLKAHTPIDFALYKEGTLLRRIERRMALRHMQNSSDYLALLKDSPEEAEKLCADLLICVTSFFRDPEAFEYLAEHVIRDLVANCNPGMPIRIWVPACATGEEAYSLAMLAIEKIWTVRKDVKLQVFASDVDEHALAIARAGVYPDSIAGDVSPDRLARFFDKEDHSYRVKPELRDAVVFAHQNILADAPFSKLDLISCRNLLIYLNAEAQERIIQMFHFALNDDGFLFLGSSETANNHEMFFQPESKKYRLYKRVGSARRRKFDFHIGKSPMFGLSTPALRTAGASQGLRLAELSQKLLVERYAPAAVLINARMEVLFVQGPTDQYLKVPTGQASQDLLAMVRDGLRAPLGGAIRTAFQTREDVTTSANVTRSGQSIAVTLGAHPLTVDEAGLVLITFADQPVKEASAPAEDHVVESQLHNQLNQELEATRLELQNTIREYERSTEELKASNEEAMSMNEEFQSTNEELETSKEELQSLNEELTTLNTQLQQKVEDERRLTDDMNNLLASSGIATLFLDRDLKIMRFTPSIRELFNVISNDVGRPFSDITSKIEDPTLLTDAVKVLDALIPVEAEVQAGDGKWFIRRALPYKTQDRKIDGVVVTFSDVTDLKTLQELKNDALGFAEAIVATVPEPMLVLDNKFHVVKANHSFCATFQMAPDETKGRPLFEMQNGQWDQPELRDLLEHILPDRTTIEDHQIEIDVPQMGRRTVLVSARELRDGKTRSNLILLAFVDITEQQRVQRDLADREARLSAIMDAAPEAIITIDESGIIGGFSPAARSILGYTAQEVLGKNIKMLMPEPHQHQHDGYLAHYKKTGEKKIIGIGRELNALHKNGKVIPIRLTVAEWWINGERHFTGILHDLTNDMKQREALQRAQKMEAVGQLTGGLAHDFNNLLTVIIGNLELLEMQIGDARKPRQLLKEALEASELGAKLTKQLLAFSRKQTLERTTVRLNDLVTSVKPLLARTLGDQITIKTELAKDLDPTMTDPGQVENAILNLAINARDAMPEGGTLTITTENVVLDKDYAATQIDLEPGRYVALSVTDTGVGMPADVVNRAFEPFFTTKGVGAGSGLGLSMVYGFAKQSGGHVTIYSEIGLGSTVTLYLPPAAKEPVMEVPSAVDIPASKNETILVVEDDPRVRRLTVARLEGLGYHILAAENGPAAIDILRGKNHIDLVLSDVVMPGGMTGFEVADQALQINPKLKVVLATGYASGGADVGGSNARSPHTILRKPYSLQELAQALRNLLE